MSKSSIHNVIDKVKSSVDETTLKIKDTAESIARVAKEKASEKSPPFNKSEKAPKKPHASISKRKATLDDELKLSVDLYNDAFTRMNEAGADLYRERTRAVDMINHVEELINSIANRPKEFDTEIAVIDIQRKTFIDTLEFAKVNLEAAKQSALSAGAGVAAGAAIVSVAPTAAMWVATTFGTASTGTAISALSGAAATNAALAWLGGGALTAGGGGMAAGQALLALAGPIGWSIAGATLLSSIVLLGAKRRNTNKQKVEEIESIKNNTYMTKVVTIQIQELLDEVISLRDNLNQQYNMCLPHFGKDFMTIERDQQLLLGALVNNTKALAATLGKSVNIE